ncbi:MAG: UDP-N-acetylmuramoyl-tripeptide--D-alanyl-D-alanine ligase [Bacteroidales bacterium]|nr:UDP-N-acetylmuramoyl-tripeptide--D-alanyl-D-alanine ligase [Bacteroidales bacterium]
MEELYAKYLACGCKVTTDSRAIRGGEIFFALRGENFDGNNYALKALEAGAAWAVVNEDAEIPGQARNDDKGTGESRLIRVADPFKTLQELAIWHRTHVRDGKLPVLGLTGTNGKTTTKNLIAAVLAKKYRVTATQGNLNNDIGVPLSLLSITPDTEMAVIEMGANHPDDIAKLVRVSQPDYGLITNVGRAHLLGFGSFEGVKAAKGELYKWLGAHRGSLIFLNEDDADLREMAAGQPCHTFGYGLEYQHAEILPATTQEPFLRIRLGDAVIASHLVGAYNATNILAALAVGEYFGVPRADAIAAIAEFVPDNNRSQMVRTEANTLIVDAYNANPSSMRAALENFGHVEAAHKLALLGDMRELGAESLEEHKKIVLQLREAGIPACLVGEEFQKALSALPGDEAWFPSSEALAEHLAAHPVHDAMILVKGSRGIQMEKVLPAL